MCLTVAVAGFACKQVASNSAVSNSKNGNSASTAGGLLYSDGKLLGIWKEKGVDLTMDFGRQGTYENGYNGKHTVCGYAYESESIIKTSCAGKSQKARFSVHGNEMTLNWIDSIGVEAATQTFEKVTQ